jgi:hypothetical protein
MDNETPKTTYDWTTKDGKVNCFASKTSACTVTGFWETTELTSFHDAELQKATREINGILDELKKDNRDPKRGLSFIQFKNRHFLVWTTPGLVGPDDDNAKIRKMLRLKAR